MTWFYAASDGGFYVSGLHTSMPADVVPIKDADLPAIQNAAADGKIIVADEHGYPTVVPAPLVPLPIALQIVVLENQITPRRVREALMGNADSMAFVKQKDAAIAALRAQLPAEAPAS